MKIFRVFRFLIGAVLLGYVAWLGWGGLLQKFATINPRFVMPSAETPPQKARFSRIESHAFRIVRPSSYEFSPSAETVAFSDKHTTRVGLRTRTWYSYWPNVSQPVPLVILLHGAGRDGLSLMEMWRQVAEKEGLALIAPDSYTPSWPETPDPEFLVSIVETFSETNQIDPKRVFLFGHSNGATYAQNLLNRTRGPWRAAVLHGGFSPLALLKTPSEAKPFRLYIGEHEHIFPLEVAEKYGKALAQRGHANDMIVIPGHTHWFYEAGPQIARHAWRWMEALANSTEE